MVRMRYPLKPGLGVSLTLGQRSIHENQQVSLSGKQTKYTASGRRYADALTKHTRAAAPTRNEKRICGFWLVEVALSPKIQTTL